MVILMTEQKTEYKKWGNNEFHNPKICEDCEYDTCSRCDNGPRGAEYRRAIVEAEWKNYTARQISGMDYTGLDDDY